MTKEETIQHINEKGVSLLEMNKIMGNYIKDRDVIKAALSKNNNIYAYLEEASKKDAQILQMAINLSNNTFNPIRHALPGALTEENIFLAIDKGLITINDLKPEMLTNKNIVVYFMTHTEKSIYHYLPENLRKDPELLRLGIIYANIYSNPMKYAPKDALTTENIFLAIDRNLLQINDFTKEQLDNEEIVTYFITKRGSSIYSKLSERLRRDPHILELAINFNNSSWNSPIKDALPEALTKENIFLAIDKGLFQERSFTKEQLDNEELAIYFMTKNGVDIYPKLSENLRRNPKVLKAALNSKLSLWTDIIKEALPEALTRENIMLAIDKNVFEAQHFTSALLDNEEIAIYFMTKNNANIYSKLSENLRKKPEVLKAALSSKLNLWNDIIKDALPEALTKENIKLAIDKNVFEEKHFTNALLDDEEIAIYFMTKKGSNIYKILSENLRKKPEVLRIAVDCQYEIWNSPIPYALPEALTVENVCAFIDSGKFYEANLTPEMLKNKTIVIHFMQKSRTSIYKEIAPELKSDPEVLHIALNSKSDFWTNPIKFALPPALTKENLILAIDKRLINSNTIPEGTLEDREVVMHFLEVNPIIYGRLSEKFRNDPEILKITIRGGNLFSECSAALPGALTEENIDSIITLNRELIEEEAYLNNKYYCLNMVAKDTKIIKKLPLNLQRDPLIIYIALIKNPKLFETYKTHFLTESMFEYIEKNNITPSEETIARIILSDEKIATQLLSFHAPTYQYLSEADKENPEYIRTIINKNGNNLAYVPNRLITDDMISLALSKDYHVFTIHADIIADFLRKKLANNPKHVFTLFLNTEDPLLNLLLVQIISLSKMEIPNNVKEKIDSIMDHYLNLMKKANYPEEHIRNFMTNIFNGQTNIINIRGVSSIYDILYATYLGNTYPDELSKLERPGTLRPMRYNTVSLDMLTKTNIKQYKELKQILLDKHFDDFTASEIALKAYAVLGYQRTKELLTEKYGPITKESLTHLFCELNCSEVIFEPDGKKFKPVLNEQFINLLFGSSYKVLNTPIRNFLNGFIEMEKYIEQETTKINRNDKLSITEKADAIADLTNSFEKYCSNIRSFLSNISTIFNRWDIIEEEFTHAQHISSIKIKLNIAEINKIVAGIKTTSSEITKLSLTTGNERIKKIPNYEPRDFPLLESDIFDYVGIDTQYTSSPHEAPARAVTLSRMMENQTSKKFPNISIEKDGYTLHIFNPQDRNLISAGYRSRCCFRPNGNADNKGENNSLLTYCCSTEYGGGLEIRDKDNETLMFTPILRNGNVLMLHSFESKGTTTEEAKTVNNLVHEWAKCVLQRSQANEGKEALVAVAATNLHEMLDVIKCKKTLSDDKKFHIYNPNQKFTGMYTNLTTTEHHVLEFADGKNSDDITYDFKVSKSYPYPIKSYSIRNVELSPEELAIIEQINENKNKIIILANQRAALLKEKNKNAFEAFGLLKTIIFIRKENILLIKRLYKINKSNKDILNEYLNGLDMINQVCDNLKTPRHTSNHRFTHIFYSYGWYLAITDDNKLYGNFIEGYAEIFFNTLSEIKKRYGLDLEIEIENENIIPKNGGLN